MVVTLLRYPVDGITVWAHVLVLVVLVRVLWCLAAFSVTWATHGLPHTDGAGVPWVLTGTHQRDAPPKQRGGDIRAPTLCGWCCRGRQCRQCRECVITRATFRHTPSAEHTWRGVRTTHFVMTTLTTQLGSLCDWHIQDLANILGFSILHSFLHLLNHIPLENFTFFGHAR